MWKPVDEIAVANLGRLEPELGSGFVHQPLDGERDYRARDPAVGRRRTGMREHSARPTPIGADRVGAGQLGHRHQGLHRTGRGKARIGAEIGDDVRSERQQFAARIEVALKTDHLVAAMEGSDEVFATILRPGH